MDKVLKILTIAAATAVCGVFATGCLKGYDGDVVYVLKPMVSDGTVNANVDRYIAAYTFNADTTNWTVASYDDALAMRLTNKITGKTLDKPMAVAVPFVEAESNGRYSVMMQLPPERVLMIVAVDTELKMYGYRQQTLTEGLTSIFETVMFYTARNSKRYKAGVWTMCNDFYVAPEPEPKPEPEPDDPENPDDPDDPENPDDPDAPENPEGGDEDEGEEGNEGDNGGDSGDGGDGGDGGDNNPDGGDDETPDNGGEEEENTENADNTENEN